MRITSSFKPLSTPYFIVLEGVNGAGKSTLKQLLIERLSENSSKVISTFEPGDTPIGKELRGLLLGDKFYRASSLTELFLFAADRAEHIAQVIKPNLAAGRSVICDRYIYSTTAFQGYGRNLDLNIINELNEVATSGLTPDLVILLDIDPLEGLKRTANRRAADSFESEELDFHVRIREGFLKIADDSPTPFLVLDATKPLNELLEQTVRYIQV